jgi:hypothetical protein
MHIYLFISKISLFIQCQDLVFVIDLLTGESCRSWGRWAWPWMCLTTLIIFLWSSSKRVRSRSNTWVSQRPNEPGICSTLKEWTSLNAVPYILHLHHPSPNSARKETHPLFNMGEATSSCLLSAVEFRWCILVLSSWVSPSQASWSQLLSVRLLNSV